ncbi:MAG: hormogonium polysaccharide biosynthesis glycosyltransferase HpsE [Saprospiraceae bacterium]
MTVSLSDAGCPASLSGGPPVADCSSISFSVAVCTYNGADRVGKVLEYLYVQKGTEKFGWEIIVIDNNSSDQTRAVIEHYQSLWRGSVPVKYCFESKQGLAFARQRAVEEARGELIGFLDDDNLPGPDWVAKAFSFAQSRPKAGAYGSYIVGQFETNPPENFERIAAFLALTDRGDKALFYRPQKKLLPPGAGLVVKKQAWLGNVPKSCFLQGRVAGHQLPGEDLEALLHIQRAGWEVWYNPEMTLLHCIPSWRLTPEYLLKLCQTIGLSRFYTRMLSVQQWWLRPAATLAYMGKDLFKVSHHLIKYRNSLDSDLVALCELKLYSSSLISPFYLLRKQLGR